MRRAPQFFHVATIAASFALVLGCSGSKDADTASSGGALTSGGTGQAGGGGSPMNGGGSSSGGSANGGASGGAATGGAAGAVTFARVQQVISANCAVPGCHADEESPLLNINLYSKLMTTSVQQCGGDRLVAPGDVANSALISLITGQCGNFRMPFGCMTSMCLTAADQATLTTWIQQGAPQ